MKEYIRRVIVWTLMLEARAVVARYKPKIILVTGSVGKTGAKDAIYAVLSSTYFVRKSEKSFNSDIGAPLTVLGLPNGWSNPARWLRNIIDGFLLIFISTPYPEWLVVEVGADRPGDISRSLAWLKPKVVVATRFPAVPVHVEFYGSPEEVRREELAPLSWLSAGGIFVGNGDDEYVRAAAVSDGVRTIFYGEGDDAEVKVQREHTLTTQGVPRGVSFDAILGTERAHVVLEGVVGRPHIAAALAGIATGVAVGISLEKATASLTDHQPTPGRQRLIEGINESVLIDDTYNASPVAVEEALKTLENIPRTGRRIAVLGDMLELGPYSVAEHEKVGREVARAADLVVTVGMRARKIAETALATGMQIENVLQFDHGEVAAAHLEGVVAPGDVVLIKGSQSMRLERVVKVLMAHPKDAKKLLCRQDSEWLAR